MQRYLLFTGDTFGPRGGWRDFDGAFDTPEEARAYAEKLTQPGFATSEPTERFIHVIDAETHTFVCSYDEDDFKMVSGDWKRPTADERARQ